MKGMLASALLLASAVSGFGLNNPAFRRLESERMRKAALHDFDSPSKLYPSYNLSVPVDHFHNDSQYEPHSNKKFNLRYWFDATHYKKGGPVILFESGEADANSRTPILHKGIVNILARATNGLGVIIEHRYYGTSQPMPNLDNKNLRFLTTDQAMADNVYFSQNIVFKGLEDMNLTSHTTPWILYGGSYSGAFVAFSRKLYPDTWWGAISSSGVVAAITDYWEYWEPIRNHAPQKCVKMTQYLTNVMDNILISNYAFQPLLRQAFNMQNFTYDDDFMSTLGNYGIGGWQGTNWDPAVSSDLFYQYCKDVSSSEMRYPKLAGMKSTVRQLLVAGGYDDRLSLDTLTMPMLNWIGFARNILVDPIGAHKLDAVFGTHNASWYHDKSLSNSGSLSWPWQFCHQWGFFQTGSGAPPTQLPLVSRLITVEYGSNVCRGAFGIYTPPDTEAINKYGSFNISYPRLAIIDGIADPWRRATPHASPLRPFNRTNTIDEPFYLIDNGSVHHWDENGLLPHEYTADLPPKSIRRIQAYEVEFVQKWMADWRDMQKAKRGLAAE